MMPALLSRGVLLATALSLCVPLAHSAPTVRIAIVLDGPVEREFLRVKQLQREIRDLVAGEFDIEFPADKIVHGGWRVEAIRDILQELLLDPGVDLIIANGLLSTHQAAQFANLNKPVIAPVTVDRILQELPYRNGTSGKDNYVYISANRTVAEDLALFHRLVGFGHLAIIADQLFLEALPQLKGTVYEIQRQLGFELTFLPVMDRLEEGLTAMPAGVDAVYVPPLLRFSEAEFKEFSQGLIELRLPGFSFLGRDELEMGLLATSRGRNIDTTRHARRIALHVQSILLGTNAADLKVDLEQPRKLAINMRTARAIGFSPKWKFIEIADLLYEDTGDTRRPMAMVEAIRRALEANLSLKISSLDAELAAHDVSNARAPLLPQLNIGAGVVQIDRDRAGAVQAERSSDADLTAAQLIYSESGWAAYEVATLLEQAENATLHGAMLDLISSSARAYLQLLLSAATEEVRRSNLKVTETNLELAEARLKIGYTDRSEVLRWQSQLASDRRNLYAAQSDRRQAAIELKRQLHLPLTEAIAVTDDGIVELLAILDSERFRRFFDNPFSFEIFTEFEVERAINNSPELQRIEHIMLSNQRRLLAAERAYYVPDVELNARYGSNIERGGRGGAGGLIDDEWSVGVQARLPLFAGGARRAEALRAGKTVLQSRYQQADVKEQIEARARAAMQQASGSYPAIRLSKDAADAANENLSLVTDAYSKGVVSITDLIDAQDAYLAANLSAAEARYAFMIDWIVLQRAVANFDLLLTADGFDKWYQALDDYYQARKR